MYRSEEQIKQDMLNNVKNTVDKTQNNLVHDALSPAAIEFALMYMELEEVASKLDVENLEGEELERFIYQRTGQERKPATKSTTIVTITGQEGAKISKGDLVGTDTVNFISMEDKTIDITGRIEVLVECESPGIIGNVPAGAIKYFPVSIAGLTSVTNPEPVINGYDAESDGSLLERYYERIRTPATSGNKYHYLNWAKEVTGVGDAKVFPLWDGDNTVKVVIIDSNKQPASEDLVERVQEHIDPKGEYIAEEDRWTTWGAGEGQAPIGAFCTVTSAMPKIINISATITKDPGYTLEEIKSNISENIIKYLKSIAFKKNLVSYAYIGSYILNTDGVLDYRDLKLNGNVENITVSDEEVATLGEVVINE